MMQKMAKDKKMPPMVEKMMLKKPMAGHGVPRATMLRKPRGFLGAALA